MYRRCSLNDVILAELCGEHILTCSCRSPLMSAARGSIMQQSPGHAKQHRLHEGMHSMLHEWHLPSQHFCNASLAIVILLYSAHEPSCARLTLRAC